MKPPKPFKPSKPSATLRKPFQGNPPSRPLAPLGSQPPQLSVFKGIQGCRLPTPEHFKPLCKPFPPASERSKPSRRHFPGNCQQRLAAACPSHLFLSMVSQQACHASRESPRTTVMTTQRCATPGMSGHGSASLC